MINGVEILAMEEVATKFSFNWTFGLIIGGGALLIMLIAGIAICLHAKDFDGIIVPILLGVVLGALFGAIAGSATEKPIEYETQYKVTISDEVSMNDFLERYEIVDQEGKIYTVRERND